MKPLRAILVATVILTGLVVSQKEASSPIHRGRLVEIRYTTDLTLQTAMVQVTNLYNYLGQMKAQDELASWLAMEAKLDQEKQQQVRPEPRPATASTGQCGGATNGADQYINRESGGNPGIYNAGGSGAYGCYQIMPGTWQASCSDLGGEIGSSASAQAECASRLPLSAWNG